MDQIRGPSTRIKDQNHCSMTEPEAWVLTWKFPTGWTLNRHGGTWCLQAPAGSPDPHSPPRMAAVECGSQLTDDYRVPSFLPNHQEWYSLFLISSSFSMYLVILLPRKRRHILDMLYYEIRLRVSTPQFLCPVTREHGTTGKWATRGKQPCRLCGIS